MRTKYICYVLTIVLGLLLLPTIANATWTALDGESVGEGIDYQYFYVGSTYIHVTRMPLHRDIYAIETCSARRAVDDGDENGLGEKIADQIERYDGAINCYGNVDLATGYWYPWWGRRSTVHAAINGGPHNYDPLTITKGHIEQGYYAKQLTNTCGLSGFLWTGDWKPYIGGCVDHGDHKAYFHNNNTMHSPAIARVNSGTAQSNELVMFTSQTAGSRTPARGTAGKEVVVRSYFPFTLNAGNTATGQVEYIGSNYGQTWIPFDCVALSGSGTTATQLATLSVGDTVTIDQAVTNKYTEEQDPGYGCENTDSSVPWDMAYAYVGGFWRFLEDSTVCTNSNDTVADYRTAVAYNDDYVYFLAAADITLQVLGNFCKDHEQIEATDGISLDGGTSTQMDVHGCAKILNTKALLQFGSWEAPVADGLMMTRISDQYISSLDYWSDQQVDTVAATALRTGPGTAYTSMGTIPDETTIMNRYHPKNGVLSQNKCWRYVEYNGNRGWVAEQDLDCCFHLWEPTSVTASLYQEEVPFGTQFQGDITYKQWYKYVSGNWIAVVDSPGHIRGATTNCLVFEEVQAGDAGTYRAKCVSIPCSQEDYTASCTLTIQ